MPIVVEVFANKSRADIMKKLFSLLAISLIVTGCAVLSGNPDPRWADYKNWTAINTTPITGDHTGFLGGLHEGAEGVRQVYVNNIGLETALGTAPYKYPVGTVVLKEQYSSQSAFDSGRSPSVTVMVKVSDDAANPTENWAWSRGYGREAKTDDAFCSACHTIAAGNDYVFSNATSLADFR